jgi:hypothetical protein
MCVIYCGIRCGREWKSMLEIGVHEYAKLMSCRCMSRVLLQMKNGTTAVSSSWSLTWRLIEILCGMHCLSLQNVELLYIRSSFLWNCYIISPSVLVLIRRAFCNVLDRVGSRGSVVGVATTLLVRRSGFRIPVGSFHLVPRLRISGAVTPVCLHGVDRENCISPFPTSRYVWILCQ